LPNSTGKIIITGKDPNCYQGTIFASGQQKMPLYGIWMQFRVIGMGIAA